MTPRIDNPAGVDLSPDTIQVLGKIFARYKRVIILKEFTAGLSGSRVLEVRPIKADGTPELPTVVKVASVSMIEQEWQAYRKHIHNRLPHAAVVASRPTMPAGGGLGGLRYPVMGVGQPDILSLRDFCALPDVQPGSLQTMLERLFRIMDNVWGYHIAASHFSLQSSYERVLPPRLVLHATKPATGTALRSVSPDNLPAQTLHPGDMVALRGFEVQKVDPARRTITFDLPSVLSEVAAFRVRVRIPETDPMPNYRAHAIETLLTGVVIETRETCLERELAQLPIPHDRDMETVQLSDRVWLPNPLRALPELLNHSRNVHVATIHGDFNLENILIEPQFGSISLIDFAEARQDHVLHDLFHLEAEIVAHILPEAIQEACLDPAMALAALSCELHHALCDPLHEQTMPRHPALQKPWVMLRTIRRAARRYLFDAADRSEYYQGLTLYLLGMLRYKNLAQRPSHPLPKQIAFWAAALAYYWLSHNDLHSPTPEIGPLLNRAQGIWGPGTHSEANRHGPSLSAPERFPPQNGADTDLMAAMPTHELSPVGTLPTESRMPLERNPRFVGRRPQLQQMAIALKHQSGAVAIVGMGGVGKTQLAIEFAHRFGRFFAGGVFWLSCADPHAMAAEIAACGAQLNLRPDYSELPIDEQNRLVIAEWEKSTPRLLIFDNCEDPELLTQWWPRQGASRLLITSRRSDWGRDAGVKALTLDVLQRSESLALLREHQPDIDSTILNSIAHELGDLPLALHLAGSYLARYRYKTDAASYLASLHQTSPLQHQSLQGSALLPTEHDPHVARTFAVSYDQLSDDEPTLRRARQLLHNAACLAPGEPISESLARLALNAQNEDAAEVARAGFELGSAIDQLLELGLLRSEANNTLWLHRLVIAFTRERLGERLPAVQKAVEQALCGEAERLNGQREPALLQAWQVHLRFVADASLARSDVEAADVCHALAEHLYQTADYRGSREYHEAALRIRQTVLGAKHGATARSLTQLGKVLIYCEAPEQARRSLEQAQEIQRSDPDHQNDLATTLNHLGFLLQLQGDLAAAQSYHEQALLARRALLGGGHPSVADSLSNLAYIEYAQGKLDQAHLLLEEAIEVQRLASGLDHPETARLLTNMGELLIAQEKFDEAEGALQQALAIQERELGTNHLQKARTLHHLGKVYRSVGSTADARLYYERAFQIYLAFHGADHPRTKSAQAQLISIVSS